MLSLPMLSVDRDWHGERIRRRRAERVLFDAMICNLTTTDLGRGVRSFLKGFSAEIHVYVQLPRREDVTVRVETGGRTGGQEVCGSWQTRLSPSRIPIKQI